MRLQGLVSTLQFNDINEAEFNKLLDRKFLYEKGKINLYTNDDAGFNGFIIAVDESSKYNKYSHCRLMIRIH